MNAAAEVARIRAEFAARNETWLRTVRERLRKGPALSVELAAACGERNRGPFSTWLHDQKKAGTLVAVGSKVGPTGSLNTVWGLP
jgi:hypothetical protein